MKKVEIGISETASENKKRRGRPTVYQRDHREDMKAICESDIDRTHRTHIAEYYRGAVFGLLEDNSDIPYLEKIFRIDNSRPACYQKGEIIEQLGRMLVQDGYSEDSVIEAATIAAKLYRMDGDSNSVVNQKRLLSQKAKEKGLTDTKFYVDDGYTGTNFDEVR